MVRRITKESETIGLPPGTPVHIGEERTEKVRITLIDYDPEHVEEKVVSAVDECVPFRDKPSVTWINVDGVHRVDIVAQFGERFGFHPLVVEDIPNTGQRPKVEDYGDYLYVVAKMLYFNEGQREVEDEQISIILGRGNVISFQEREGDVFDPLRERIRNAKGRIRLCGPDYLCYSIIDAIVDHYFVVCEKLGERVETVQEELIQEPSPENLHEMHVLKQNVLTARKSMWPMREVVGALARGDAALITEQTEAYLRDAHDHSMQVVDTLETFRESLGSMLDIYLSSISNRMNEIMKVLTMIATIFIPLSFVAGLYGMNFAFMPELHWHYGYPFALGIMACIAGGMVLYFRKKGWL